MGTPSDHWLARNFAANDAATRNNMRNLVIPGWQKDITIWQDIITFLEQDTQNNAEVISDARQAVAELESNIFAAEERLNSNT